MAPTAPPNVTFFRPRREGPEQGLEDAVVRKIPNLFGMNRPVQWTGGSLAVGAGLPDLLIVSGREDLRILATAELCEAKILAFLRVVNRATAPDIAALTKKPRAHIDRCLDRLQELRAVAQDQRAGFRLTPAWRAFLPEIIAIEVKVSDWQKAISQAARNRVFTHRSYIAVPIDLARRIKRESKLLHFGIGVLAIDSDGEIFEMRRSRKIRPRVWDYYYYVTTLAARHLHQI